MNHASRIFWMLALVLAAGSQWDCKKSKAENSALPAAGISAELVVKAIPLTRREWIVTTPITGKSSHAVDR